MRVPEPSMKPWDRSAPRVELQNQTSARVTTDISEGTDEIGYDTDDLIGKINDIERGLNGEGNDGLDGEGGKSVSERVKDMEERLNNASIVCNEDGTVTLTI